MCDNTSNKRAAGNGAITIVFHIGRLSRAVPDHERWATHLLIIL
jgi:hypothetical protein